MIVDIDYKLNKEDQVTRPLYDTISAALKTLLEAKEMNQSLENDLDDIKSAATSDRLRQAIDTALNDNWNVIQTEENEARQYLSKLITKNDPPPPVSVSFIVPEIKTTWTTCNENSLFKLIKAHDLVKGHSSYQVVAFTMQCQSCWAVPEIFIVQRRDLTINFSGGI